MRVKPSNNTDFLKIIENSLVVWLRRNDLATSLARPPFTATRSFSVTSASELPLKDKPGRRPELKKWPQHCLEAKPNPVLVFVLEGQVDMGVGVTEQMILRAGCEDAHGVYQLRLPVKSLLVYPPNVPLPDGNVPHWAGEGVQPDSTLLWVDILPQGAVLHTCHCIRCAHLSGSAQFIFDSRLALLVDWLLEELEAELDSPESAPRSGQSAHSLLEVLLLRLSTLLSHFLSNQEAHNILTHTEGAARNSQQSSIVKRACNYIQGRLTQKLTVEMIARQTLVSSTQLNRLFRAEFGQSPMEYVIEQRLNTAKSFLTQTDLPVNVIATNVGIQSAVYFSRMFREKTGMTPQEYRQSER